MALARQVSTINGLHSFHDSHITIFQDPAIETSLRICFLISTRPSTGKNLGKLSSIVSITSKRTLAYSKANLIIGLFL
jgi:hypothetical protein